MVDLRRRTGDSARSQHPVASTAACPTSRGCIRDSGRCSRRSYRRRLDYSFGSIAIVRAAPALRRQRMLRRSGTQRVGLKSMDGPGIGCRSAVDRLRCARRGRTQPMSRCCGVHRSCRESRGDPRHQLDLARRCAGICPVSPRGPRNQEHRQPGEDREGVWYVSRQSSCRRARTTARGFPDVDRQQGLFQITLCASAGRALPASVDEVCCPSISKAGPGLPRLAAEAMIIASNRQSHRELVRRPGTLTWMPLVPSDLSLYRAVARRLALPGT